MQSNTQLETYIAQQRMPCSTGLEELEELSLLKPASSWRPQTPTAAAAASRNRFGRLGKNAHIQNSHRDRVLDLVLAPTKS